MPPLEFKQRLRLPDALPEADLAPRQGRSRRAILTWGAVSWALATAIGWILLQRHSEEADQTPPTSPIPDAPPVAAPLPAPPPRAEQTLPAATHSTGNVAPPPLLPGCEEARAAISAELTQSDWALPRDMTDTNYGALMDGPGARAALKHCASNRSYRVELCVMVLGVKAVGVSADAEPENAAVSACINRAIATMRFPHQPTPQLLRSRITL